LQSMPYVKISVYQKDKTKKSETIPEWFTIARDLAIQAISISKNQSQVQTQMTPDTDNGPK
jgi:hypothetical protein